MTNPFSIYLLHIIYIAKILNMIHVVHTHIYTCDEKYSTFFPKLYISMSKNSNLNYNFEDAKSSKDFGL